MSAAAQPSAPTTHPDPSGAAAPSRLNRVLSLVRRLIDYGKQLANTVQQRAAAPGFARFAKPFGTTDLAAILARITAGLHRAAALEAALCRRAARGRDLTPLSIRMPAIRGPRPARLLAPPDAVPERPSPAQDPLLAHLPTEAEIAARLATGLDPVVRRRPVGAVIVDICRDLGITPGDCDQPFWDELCHAIIAYGGNLAGYFCALNQRMLTFSSDDHPDWADPPWPAAPPRLPVLATGPP